MPNASYLRHERDDGVGGVKLGAAEEEGGEVPQLAPAHRRRILETGSGLVARVVRRQRSKFMFTETLALASLSFASLGVAAAAAAASFPEAGAEPASSRRFRKRSSSSVAMSSHSHWLG